MRCLRDAMSEFLKLRGRFSTLIITQVNSQKNFQAFQLRHFELYILAISQTLASLRKIDKPNLGQKMFEYFTDIPKNFLKSFRSLRT